MSDNPKFYEEKGRFWWAVIYPDSMVVPVEEWGSIIQKPYCFAFHDKDNDGHKGDRKKHYHLIVVWNNNTTGKSALSLFQEIMPSCCHIEKVKDINYCYEYLIHNTDSSRQKYQYNKSERIECNNFDIGLYHKVSLEEKEKMCDELTDWFRENAFTNYYEFFFSVCDHFDYEYKAVARAHQGFFNSLCKGLYHKIEYDRLKEIEGRS